MSASGATRGLGVRIRLVAVAPVDTPTALAVRGGDPTLYVAEQAGRVVAVRDGEVTGTVLDVTRRISAGGEQGLLGLAFGPDGTHLYVNFTDRDGDTRIEEYAFDGERADPGSRRELLHIEQPQPNHNGGQLAFGPDEMLYIATGDGGGGGDEGDGHAEVGNGQSLDTLLGKILRIDPRASGGAAYRIPPDNPFADGGGRPEIWSYGLRNPWRFSFDADTGDLWIGDVGQDSYEEIDRAAAPDAGRGVNYGWNVFEGRHRFRDGEAPGATGPILEVPRDRGDCSIIGGYVYRGSAIPALAGIYLYTDYCNGRIRGIRLDADARVSARGNLGATGDQISSFGEGVDGELYVLSQSDGLLRIASR